MSFDNIPPEEAWVIGIFEGEGSIIFDNRRKDRHSVCLSIQMTDRDVVERIHAIMGIGTFRGPYQYGNRKPTWTWRLFNSDDIKLTLSRWQPYLCGRRAERTKIALGKLEHIWEITPRETCFKGHRWTEENTIHNSKYGFRACRTCRAIRLPQKYKKDVELLVERRV